MTDDAPRITRSIFVHVVEVELTCPLCQTKVMQVFQREEPSQGFHPALVTCGCGRYSFSHSGAK